MEADFTLHFGNLLMVFFLGLPAFALATICQALFLHFFASGTKITSILSILILSRIGAFLLSWIFYTLLFHQLDILIGKILIPVLISEIIICPAILSLKGYDIRKITSLFRH